MAPTLWIKADHSDALAATTNGERYDQYDLTSMVEREYDIYRECLCRIDSRSNTCTRYSTTPYPPGIIQRTVSRGSRHVAQQDLICINRCEDDLSFPSSVFPRCPAHWRLHDPCKTVGQKLPRGSRHSTASLRGRGRGSLSERAYSESYKGVPSTEQTPRTGFRSAAQHRNAISFLHGHKLHNTRACNHLVLSRWKRRYNGWSACCIYSRVLIAVEASKFRSAAASGSGIEFER
jgi:hypothetical protein